MLTRPNRRIVYAGAAVNTASSEDGNSDEASAEQKVKYEAEEGEEGDASKKAGQNDGEGGVDDCSA